MKSSPNIRRTSIKHLSAIVRTEDTRRMTARCKVNDFQPKYPHLHLFSYRLRHSHALDQRLSHLFPGVFFRKFLSQSDIYNLCVNKQVICRHLRMDIVHGIGVLHKSGTCNHSQGDSFAGLCQLTEQSCLVAHILHIFFVNRIWPVRIFYFTKVYCLIASVNQEVNLRPGMLVISRCTP